MIIARNSLHHAQRFFRGGIERIQRRKQRRNFHVVPQSIVDSKVLVGAPTDTLRRIREDFLRQFAVIELDEAVAREAIMLRQEYKLKLPDAIIWASARLNNALLITRNARDFDRGEPGIRIPYRL